MNKVRAIRAKIVQHGDGLGLPHTDLVRRRAAEIAAIDGRSEPTEQHWQEAKRELHGGHSINLDDGDDQMVGTATEREIPGSLGHHAERVLPEDNENVVEELIA